MLAVSVVPRGRGKIILLIHGKLWGGESWLPNDIQIISYSIIRYEYLLLFFGFFFLLKSFFPFFYFGLSLSQVSIQSQAPGHSSSVGLVSTSWSGP